jgi:hypothetical protein
VAFALCLDNGATGVQPGPSLVTHVDFGLDKQPIQVDSAHQPSGIGGTCKEWAHAGRLLGLENERSARHTERGRPRTSRLEASNHRDHRQPRPDHLFWQAAWYAHPGGHQFQLDGHFRACPRWPLTVDAVQARTPAAQPHTCHHTCHQPCHRTQAHWLHPQSLHPSSTTCGAKPAIA